MENGNNGNGSLRLFTANEKPKRQTSVCFLQLKVENGVGFPWSANDKR
jgi:hypothetical protein